MKAAVAELGKETECTARTDPGVELAEKRQQKRLQVEMQMTMLLLLLLLLIMMMMITATMSLSAMIVTAESRHVRLWLAAHLPTNNPFYYSRKGRWSWCVSLRRFTAHADGCRSGRFLLPRCRCSCCFHHRN
jgi:hypothetical protein